MRPKSLTHIPPTILTILLLPKPSHISLTQLRDYIRRQSEHCEIDSFETGLQTLKLELSSKLVERYRYYLERKHW